MTYRPKRCGNSIKDEDNSPKTLNDTDQITVYEDSLKNNKTKMLIYVYNESDSLSLGINNP